MVHNPISAIVAAVKGYCDIHGASSTKCGAAKEAGGYAVAVIGGIWLLQAMGS